MIEINDNKNSLQISKKFHRFYILCSLFSPLLLCLFLLVLRIAARGILKGKEILESI